MIPYHLCIYRPPTSRCEITLENGDVTSAGNIADLLIISAFAGDYLETQNSVIGSLGGKGLSIQTQLRPHAIPAGENCWISRELDDRNAALAGARRVLCYESNHSRVKVARQECSNVDGSSEMIGGVALLELRTLFAALLQHAPHEGVPAWSIHMSLVGAGDQGGNPELTLKLIVSGFQEAFANGLNVRSVRIIEKNKGKFNRLQTTFASLQENYNPFTAGINPESKYRLFISYCQKNKDLVHPAYEAIKKSLGPDIFIDFDGKVNEGMVLSRDLAIAVRQSRAMIAIISPDYVLSGNCNIEFFTAYTRNYLGDDFSLKAIFLDADPSRFPAEYRDVMGAICPTGGKELAAEVLRIVGA